MIGSHSPSPPPSSYDAQGASISNLGSHEFLVTLLSSAQRAAEAEHAQTFASVTITEPRSAISGISAMTGAVSEPSEVSDVRADGAPCKTIELASHATTRTCWFAPATMTGPPGISADRYTARLSGCIGRITTAGVISRYTGTGILDPEGITAGPDGALWFTNWGNNSIGRITTSGAVTNFTHAGVVGPLGIAKGPDGALWFTNWGNNSIGRITTAGAISNYTSTGFDGPAAIAAGPDRALWLTNFFGNSIGRIKR